MRKISGLLVAAVAASVLFVLPVRAAVGPSHLIEAVTAEVTEIVKTKTGADREAAIQQVLQRNFDWTYLARAALGTHWNEASEQQRVRFVRALEATEARAYSERFAKLAEYILTIDKVVSRPNRVWTVDSLFSKAGQAIKLEWEVRDDGQGPRITDIRVAGISLFLIRHSEFNSFIQNNGGTVEPLVKELELRAAR